MAVSCQTCGISMTIAERTRNRTNTSGNWHTDCEYLEHVRDVGAAADAYYKAEVVKSLAKLVAKKNGTPTNFP